MQASSVSFVKKLPYVIDWKAPSRPAAIGTPAASVYSL